MKKYLNEENFKKFVSDFFDNEKSKAFIDFKVDKLISKLLTEKIYEDTKESFLNTIDTNFIEKYLLPLNSYIFSSKQLLENISKFHYSYNNDTHTVYVSKKLDDTIHLIKFPSFTSKTVGSYTSSDIEYRAIIDNSDNKGILKKNKTLYKERNQQPIGYNFFAFNNDFDEIREKNRLEYKNDNKMSNTIDFLEKYIAEAFNKYGEYCISDIIDKDFLEICTFINDIEIEINNIKKHVSYKEIFEFMQEKEMDFKNLKEEDLDILKLSFDYNIDKLKFTSKAQAKNNKIQVFKV